MKRFALLFLLFDCTFLLSAQDREHSKSWRPRNEINVNMLGNGTNMSLNFQRLFRLNNNFFIAGSAGAGYGRQLAPGTPESDTLNRPVYLALPLLISFNAGMRIHFLEAGIGNTIALGNVMPHYLYYLSGGYRLQPLRSGNLSIRIYGNWLISNHSDSRNLFFVPFGASLGIVF